MRRPPGPKPSLPLPLDQLQREIAQLPHRHHRTLNMQPFIQRFRGAFSRRQIQRHVRAHRTELRRQHRRSLRRVRWRIPNTAWAIDATDVGRDRQGRILRLISCRDLASRFQFEPRTCLTVDGQIIEDYLQRLFRRYGPPLLLKRDNGSSLNTDGINRLLERYGVISLNSPVALPRYNGAIERGIGIFKSGLVPALPIPEQWELASAQALVAAQTHLENCRQRRCLAGATSAETFLGRPRLRADRRARRLTFDWIAARARAILSQMEKPDLDRAWRWAVESWLRCQELIVVSLSKQNRKCYPISNHHLGH
ncbi:MAG: transposase family protein [Opitutaceae bacterium]|nr:transposase family protein [Opitutaceae bacterium]